ncbi:hypothetical protein DPMN_184265 [Dreissena polymorpha]|uniref:Uncharacterized protein n=1 Tax=Dreissena polymorpha TaxID=45954 RepID=A0A9D4I696_DREPO|nr:hypothetical protein DPMN_184265 [Dreissena polymorpha]
MKNISPRVAQNIIWTNLLTKFHDDRKINVAPRVLTRFYYSHLEKKAPPPGAHFHEDWTINVASRVKNTQPIGSHNCQAKVTIFELIKEIIGANLLTKFREDRKINVVSGVLTREYVPPLGGHVFQPTGIIFELVQDIIGINLLTKFHEDQTINVASRVTNAPSLGSHVFQANTNLLSKFHEDWKINVASKELTSQMLTADDARRTKRDHKSSP